MIPPLEEYFFYLHGYTIINNALNADHFRLINAWIDALRLTSSPVTGTATRTRPSPSKGSPAS
jgi:hypothetical protein